MLEFINSAASIIHIKMHDAAHDKKNVESNHD